MLPRGPDSPAKQPSRPSPLFLILEKLYLFVSEFTTNTNFFLIKRRLHGVAEPWSAEVLMLYGRLIGSRSPIRETRPRFRDVRCRASRRKAVRPQYFLCGFGLHLMYAAAERFPPIKAYDHLKHAILI